MSTRNSIVQGAVIVGVACLLSAIVVYAQVQSSDQQKCLNKVNKDGTGVAKQQGKENYACVKGVGTGKILGSAQTCLTADSQGKVLKKKNKTVADDASSCGTAPSFGYTGATNANNSAVQGEVDLMSDVFGGPPIDPAVISCSSNKPACICQQKVLSKLLKVADTKLGEFVKCKKAVLKAGGNSASVLQDCVNNAGTPGSIAADTKGKIAKAMLNLNTAITKSCDTLGVTAGSFPGNCTGLNDGTLGTCLDTQVECRICQIINEMDGLFVNCDAFDNGIIDGSCDSGTGPTPTPMPTTTPMPTATATCAPPPVLVGSLVPTAGRFNYNAMIGLPAANSACNSNFAGSHPCTYFELQCAEAAGTLVGAKDTANNAVTSYWAIDPAKPPLQQCQDDVVSFQNWEYATAHTGSRGQKVALNNGTGVLGPLQSGPALQCNFSTSNLGCCQ